jgi:hypothetical protein
MTNISAHSYRTFHDFYPFYLAEHANRTCRRLHFIGSCLVLAVLVTAAATTRVWLLWFIPVLGYGFAWVGHFAYEKNRPATFRYPLYSLMGDWVMFKDMLIGRIRF